MSHYIKVKSCDLELIKEQIVEHGALSTGEPRTKIPVEIWNEVGFSVIKVPEATHAYEVANLICWLSDIAESSGWYQGVVKYYFEMDPDNPCGDTLIGVSQNNKYVSLYLPEIILSEISAKKIEYSYPPQVSNNEADLTFEFDCEDLLEDMNPRLEHFSPLADIPTFSSDPVSNAKGCLGGLVVLLGVACFATEIISNL
ncbi:MAG: hypothetical protein COA78_31815 [Blastopirellula sp.]|nr:MAG: hypothetical protein COA78_31815 [Blastopirellula sp.]